MVEEEALLKREILVEELVIQGENMADLQASLIQEVSSGIDIRAQRNEPQGDTRYVSDFDLGFLSYGILSRVLETMMNYP